MNAGASIIRTFFDKKPVYDTITKEKNNEYS